MTVQMIDEESFIRTLLAEQVAVLAYIQSMVRRADVADDIFQDVCVAAMEKRGAMTDVSYLRNWLRTASRLRAMKAITKRRAEPMLLDETTLDAMESAWRDRDGTDASVYAEHLRHCTPLLSPTHRDLLARRFVDGREYAQLAVESNRPVKSLYVTFSRIYAALAKCIGNRMSAEGRVRHA